MAKRTGSGGRPPFGTPQGRHSKQLNLTIPLELNARLEKFCEDDESKIMGSAESLGCLAE